MTIIVQENKRNGHWVVIVNFENYNFDNNGFPFEFLEQMGKWCEENNCGRRMAYDQFWFKTKKQLNWFLLKYS